MFFQKKESLWHVKRLCEVLSFLMVNSPQVCTVLGLLCDVLQNSDFSMLNIPLHVLLFFRIQSFVYSLWFVGLKAINQSISLCTSEVILCTDFK